MRGSYFLAILKRRYQPIYWSICKLFVLGYRLYLTCQKGKKNIMYSKGYRLNRLNTSTRLRIYQKKKIDTQTHQIHFLSKILIIHICFQPKVFGQIQVDPYLLNLTWHKNSYELHMFIYRLLFFKNFYIWCVNADKIKENNLKGIHVSLQPTGIFFFFQMYVKRRLFT